MSIKTLSGYIVPTCSKPLKGNSPAATLNPYILQSGFVEAAGLITFPFGYKGQVTDVNEALSSGIYRIYGTPSNGPEVQFGVLVVFEAYGYLMQIATDVGNVNPSFYLRTRNSQYVWSNWARL